MCSGAWNWPECEHACSSIRLRLFLSPYFSISVAMHYLKTYSDSIGISHYLCWRMRGMSTEEVESYWPQIWCVYDCQLAVGSLKNLTLTGQPSTSHLPDPVERLGIVHHPAGRGEYSLGYACTCTQSFDSFKSRWLDRRSARGRHYEHTTVLTYNRHSGSCRQPLETSHPRGKPVPAHSSSANASCTAATRSFSGTFPSPALANHLIAPSLLPHTSTV